jgi:hypothetical protein
MVKAGAQVKELPDAKKEEFVDIWSIIFIKLISFYFLFLKKILLMLTCPRIVTVILKI